MGIAGIMSGYFSTVLGSNAAFTGQMDNNARIALANHGSFDSRTLNQDKRLTADLYQNSLDYKIAEALLKNKKSRDSYLEGFSTFA
ncbi:MAG: hypothetical protein LBK53_02320 [Heliobacteriaceae bacterium]|jgi:hypothetical protein|nr:hypothetical protein [Heliobacteriaceae bacterium]